MKFDYKTLRVQLQNEVKKAMQKAIWEAIGEKRQFSLNPT